MMPCALLIDDADDTPRLMLLLRYATRPRHYAMLRDYCRFMRRR